MHTSSDILNIEVLTLGIVLGNCIGSYVLFVIFTVLKKVEDTTKWLSYLNVFIAFMFNVSYFQSSQKLLRKYF